MRVDVVAVEPSPELAAVAELDSVRALLDGDAPAGIDELSADARRHVLQVRDAQRAVLDIFDTVRGLTALASQACLAPLPHIAAYHLAACGWRKHFAPSDGVDAARELLAADLEQPTDPRGVAFDLAFAPSVRDAVALKLSRDGWRRDDALRRIKLRRSTVAGVAIAVWVPIDAPDMAGDDLRPNDDPRDATRPWDVRALAALRRTGGNADERTTWAVKPAFNIDPGFFSGEEAECS